MNGIKELNDSIIESQNSISGIRNKEAGGAHYGKGLQPWDLQRHMQSWGSVFVDARRTDVIEYLFRKKGDTSKQLDDARKALHNVQEIIKELEQYEIK